MNTSKTRISILEQNRSKIEIKNSDYILLKLSILLAMFKYTDKKKQMLHMNLIV